MARKVPLSLTQLEAREVPAASLFADIRAGIWGSYPMHLTPSGSALFFTADNGHGYELYRTDGTPGSAKMVRDIKPGVGGSTPMSLIAADNGVVFFTADDGTGRALWKSDGTAAGTTKVPGVPAGAVLDNTSYENQHALIAKDGKLYFTALVQGPYPTSRWHQLWATNGTTTTKLADLGLSYPGTRNELSIANGKVTLNRFEGGFTSQWTTDGTAAGTRRPQLGLSGSDPSMAPIISAPLGAGVQLPNGKFVHPMRVSFHGKVGVWVSDGITPSAAKLIAAIPFDGVEGGSAQELVRLGDKVYFTVKSEYAQYRGLWETDGTATGTRRVDVPALADTYPRSIRAFDGKLLLGGYDSTAGKFRYFLSNGTAAGTAEVSLPEAPADGYSLRGEFPDPAGSQGPALLFKLGPTGRLYYATGTTGGWMDTAGLPTGFNLANASYRTDGAGRAVSSSSQAGVYFNGDIYFQAANGEQRAELWKWNPFTTQVPPQGDPPAVTSVSVNDGAAQRSTVTSLIVSFDRAVNIEDGALQLKDATGKVHLLYVEDPVQGQNTLNIHFGGPSLPDGRYTLTVKAGRVTDAETGAALEQDYTFTFTRLYGDLNGDGTYDRDTRTKVRSALGAQVGNDDRYLASLDWNMDGVIDSTDELAAVRNWGKTV